ncbi:MAG: molybdopterin-dependent oxidoreductase, partial [Acidimicrobiia bacterium]|nr:molybdopterin-dependent oxidoreductase [Acidimicrobiia bacterium]
TISYNTAANLRGQFHIPAFLADVRCVLTNKTPNTPVRGAGRPEAVFVIDRVVDMIAAELAMDPADVRFVNLVPAEAMPYDSGMLYRDGVQMVYDSGDYPAQLRRALDVIDYAGWRKRQRETPSGKRRIGIGISAHLEGSGIGPFEGASVRVDATGRLVVHSGSNPHGQGHETTLAQVCVDVFGVTPDDVSVHAGDTALIPFGGGTNASRSAVTAGSAVHVAADTVREKVRAVAGAVLEISPEDLVVSEGLVHPIGAPSQSMTLAEVAAAVAPQGSLVTTGTFEAGLDAVEYFHPPTVTFASGTHLAVVEVDIETGGVRILDYVIVDDCGRAMNPTIVDGQQHGGVAHGIGQTLFEEAVYNEDGQMTTGTMMDYLLPSPTEVPNMTVVHENHPTPLNPLGVKGIGEGGTTSAPGAIINAIADALGPEFVLTKVPVRPADLVHL